MNMYLRQLYLSQLYLNQLQNQFFLRGGSGRGGSGRGGSGRGGSGGEDNSTFGDRLAALRSDSAAQEESQQENRDYQRLVEISVRENHRSGGFKGTHGNHCTLVFMLHYLQDDGRVKPIEGPHLSIYDSVPGKSDGTLPDGIPFKKVYGKIHVFEPFLTSKLSVINQVYNYGKPDTSVSNRHFHKALYKAIPNDSLRDQLLKDLVQKHIYTGSAPAEEAIWDAKEYLPRRNVYSLNTRSTNRHLWNVCEWHFGGSGRRHTPDLFN